jgi:hypothetical protein
LHDSEIPRDYEQDTIWKAVHDYETTSNLVEESKRLVAEVKEKLASEKKIHDAVDSAPVTEPQLREIISPCSKGVPKTLVGVYSLCESCEDQLECLKKRKEWKIKTDKDYVYSPSTVCPHADEIPEDKIGRSAFCKNCSNNTYPYGNYCKLKKEST